MKRIIGFAILTAVLVSCGSQQQPSIVEDSNRDITSNSVYVDIAKKDDTGNYIVETIHVGDFPDNQIPDDSGINRLLQQKLSSDGKIAAQQATVPVRLCTRTVANVHISKTQAARGQLIAKGTITCPPTPIEPIQVRAMMKIDKWTGKGFFDRRVNTIAVRNLPSFTTSTTNRVFKADYQYWATGNCQTGFFLGVSEVNYQGKKLRFTVAPQQVSKGGVVEIPTCNI